MPQSSLKFEIESKTVAEFRKLNVDGELILQPEYQRKLVWPQVAQVSLMETILLGYPIPEIYLAYETSSDGDQVASVVDGQQRLTALLTFVDNEYALDGLEEESLSEFEGKYFKNLPDDVRKEFFQYRFPIRRLSNLSEEFVRSVFARVNRVNMVLTGQEIRNAMMPGPFLDFLKDCATHELTVASGVFSPQRRSRGGDLEFFAGVFGSCIFGLSNKSLELDERYDKISDNFEEYRDNADSFLALLTSLRNDIKWEGRTRWSNIVDMFTLIHVGWEFREFLASPEGRSNRVRVFFDEFQRAVSSYRSRGAEGVDLIESRSRLSQLLETPEEIVEDSVAKYVSGVRNSSDLGARRARSQSLRGLMEAL